MTAAQKQKMDVQDKVVEDCGIIQFQLKMTKSLVQQFPDLTAETFVLKNLFVFFRECSCTVRKQATENKR